MYDSGTGYRVFRKRRLKGFSPQLETSWSGRGRAPVGRVEQCAGYRVHAKPGATPPVARRQRIKGPLLSKNAVLAGSGPTVVGWMPQYIGGTPPLWGHRNRSFLQPGATRGGTARAPFGENSIPVELGGTPLRLFGGGGATAGGASGKTGVAPGRPQGSFAAKPFAGKRRSGGCDCPPPLKTNNLPIGRLFRRAGAVLPGRRPSNCSVCRYATLLLLSCFAAGPAGYPAGNGGLRPANPADGS
jgi:hypothetical protein